MNHLYMHIQLSVFFVWFRWTSIMDTRREMAIEALSERLDSLILSEESSEEPEEYDEIPRPSISRRPRRLTRSRHIDIRSFFTAGKSAGHLYACLVKGIGLDELLGHLYACLVL